MSMTADAGVSNAQQAALLTEVSQFIYREARLQDEHAYDEWEALWTDDAIYWVPANGADIESGDAPLGPKERQLRDFFGLGEQNDGN